MTDEQAVFMNKIFLQKEKLLIVFIIACCTVQTTFAQYSKDSIQTDVALYNKRQSFDRYIRETVIQKAFAAPLDSNSEYDYESACSAATSYLIASPAVKKGVDTLFAHYDSLQYSTKRQLLEAVAGIYPTAYNNLFKQLIIKETVPKLFAMQAVYLYNNDSSKKTVQQIEKQLLHNFKQGDTLLLLQELKKYLHNESLFKHQRTPDIALLFSHQQTAGVKTIYSFQRWNRNYPGLAVVQNEDGSFAKDSAGKVLMFRQLARSASNLPYFITDGNTPQGIYSIQSVMAIRNTVIGPTPTLQLLLPGEEDSLYFHTPVDSTADFSTNYLNLLPAAWRSYLPVQEALFAGKIGRTEIIAHGTAINPEYYRGKPYYPLTPSLGCLCAKEIWNLYDGKIEVSEQLNLVNAFLQTPGDTGYLFVINLDNKQVPVSTEEVSALIETFR